MGMVSFFGGLICVVDKSGDSVRPVWLSNRAPWHRAPFVAVWQPVQVDIAQLSSFATASQAFARFYSSSADKCGRTNATMLRSSEARSCTGPHVLGQVIRGIDCVTESVHP